MVRACAGVTMTVIHSAVSDRAILKESFRRNRGKYHGPNDLKSGQRYEHDGREWLIYDFDAVASVPFGVTLVLVSPNFKEMLRYVKIEV